MSESLKQYLKTNPGQVKLAQDLGVSQSAVAMWLSGKNKIAPKNLARVSQVTGIPIKELRPDLAGYFE